MFQVESGLSLDTLFDIVKYLFEKRKRKFKFSNLKSFVKNGVAFSVFYYITTRECVIPKTVKFNPLTKKSNNEFGLELFCMESQELKSLIEINNLDINGPHYPRIIELVLRLVCFQKTDLQTIITKSKKLFKTIGIDIHKEKDIYNGLYIIRLFHILTDHEVPLIDTFNESTDFKKILLPIFKKYHIPFFLNSRSFEYDEIPNTILQYQIIFNKFEEKIPILLGEETKQLSKVEAFLERLHNPPALNILSTPEKEEEKVFLSAVNIIFRELGLRYFEFDDVIEEGFIPKTVMFLLHIDSIENVTDIESNSIDVQIKNLEAVYNFVKKDNPSIENFMLDFKSERSFSTRVLLRFILDTYFLKSSREELISRYYRITEGINKRISPSEDQLVEVENMIKLPYFIVNGNTNCNINSFSEGNDFCTKHNIPLIMKFSRFKLCGVDEYYFYQLQVFYNMIDKRKSLCVIEKFKYVLREIHKLKVPRISTIIASIKVKNVHLEQNDEQEQINDEEDEKEEEEIDDLPIKMNENPTTIKDRLNEIPSVDQNQIETPEKYWNPEKYLNNAHLEKGVLLSDKHKSDDGKHLERWNNTTIEVQKGNYDSKQEKFNIGNPSSKSQAKYYKLFYYNEESNMWTLNSESSEELHHIVNPKHRNVTYFTVCYLDSNEEDLILLNSKFIDGTYPKFDDEKEIFVYALIGNSFPNVIEKNSPPEEEEEASKAVPVFLLIHVPKKKRNHPNIKTIIIQIYSLLSLFCHFRIVILNKSFYEIQIHNMLSIFNIIDKNIEKQQINNSFKRCDSDDDNDDDESKPINLIDLGCQGSYCDHNDRKRYQNVKSIFLINEESIKNYNVLMDRELEKTQLYTKISANFNNNFIMKIININDSTTYEGFLDALNSELCNIRYFYIDFDDNFIEEVSHISGRYISIKHDKKDQYSVIKSMIKKYYLSYHSLNVLFKFDKFSPKLDESFQNDCKNILNEMISKVHIDRKILKDQLYQSATEHLEYINYQILKVIFPGLKQLEKLKIAHFSFIEKEYFNIIKALAKEDLAGILYNKYIEILNKQIKKDNLRIQEIFTPCIKKIQKKDTPKEESFKDVKQKGTSYIMKETENVREIKVTLEMKDDLRSIIEQDF